MLESSGGAVGMLVQNASGSARTYTDTDEDGLSNAQDNDTDSDGCLDVTEAGFTDPDGDGLLGPAALTVDADGKVTSGADGYTAPDVRYTNQALTAAICDTDGDLVSLVDLDDDNDGILDSVELACTPTGTVAWNAVTDGDLTAAFTLGTHRYGYNTSGLIKIMAFPHIPLTEVVPFYK